MIVPPQPLSKIIPIIFSSFLLSLHQDVLAAAAKSAPFLQDKSVQGPQQQQLVVRTEIERNSRGCDSLLQSSTRKIEDMVSSIGHPTNGSSMNNSFPCHHHHLQMPSSVLHQKMRHQGREQHERFVIEPPCAGVSASYLTGAAAVNQHVTNTTLSSANCPNFNSSYANFTTPLNNFVNNNVPTATFPIMVNGVLVPYHFPDFVPDRADCNESAGPQEQMQGVQNILHQKGSTIRTTVEEGRVKSNIQRSAKKSESSVIIKKNVRQMVNTPPKANDTTSIPSSGKPRRPLNAYNFFFREEREAIIAEVGYALTAKRQKDCCNPNEQEVEVTKILQSPPSLPEALKIEVKRKMELKTQELLDSRKESDKQRKGVHRRIHGIGFRPLSKAIAERWKTLEPERKAYYKNLAKIDTDRYTSDMNEYASSVLNLSSDTKP